MHTKKTYTTLEIMWWTRFESLLFFGIIGAWVLLYFFLDLDWLQIPWTPLALIGTAVTFVIGFQNNAAYGRIWEARMIWGGIEIDLRQNLDEDKNTIPSQFEVKFDTQF